MRLTKVVLDTNVVVSGHLKAGGLEVFVLDLALASKLQLYVSPDILAEYEEVLRRRSLSFTPCFSWVAGNKNLALNRFNGFVARSKPLKRLINKAMVAPLSPS